MRAPESAFERVLTLVIIIDIAFSLIHFFTRQDDASAAGDDNIEEMEHFFDLVEQEPEVVEEEEEDLLTDNEEDEAADELAPDGNDNLNPPVPGDAIQDTRANRCVVVKKPPTCRACGEAGHKWPTCKQKSIEFILAGLGVIPTMQEAEVLRISATPRAPELPSDVVPAPQHRRVASAKVSDVVPVASLKRAEPPLAASDSSGARPAKSGRVAQPECIECGEGIGGGEGWRLTVNTCKKCKCLVHLKCAQGSRDFVCRQCQQV